MSDASDRPTVLLISSDTIGPKMAGTGIRYWNLARVIAHAQPVTLASPFQAELTPPTNVTLSSYHDADNDERGHNLVRLIEQHDVVVSQHLPYLYAGDELLRERFLIVDLYAPWILEKLEHARVDPEEGERNRKDDVDVLNRLLGLGDAFICASERQRDIWLGALAAAGRLDLPQVQADADVRRLIDVVPFGLSSETPRQNGAGPRQIIPGIGDNDPLILWNGGLWNWLDPFTAIRAMPRLVEHRPRATLVFMGVRSPVAEIAKMRVVEDARALADELNLLDRHVFFHDWVPYEDRQNWLLQADVGLSLHLNSLESRFAYRTRMLDNIWCGLPVVATNGDVLADLVERERVGIVVEPNDPDAVADALIVALDPERQRMFRANLGGLVERNTWENVAAPLLRWCRNPAKVSEPGTDPRDRYTHHLEQIYSETAEYARRLERVIEEKDQHHPVAADHTEETRIARAEACHASD